MVQVLLDKKRESSLGYNFSKISSSHKSKFVWKLVVYDLSFFSTVVDNKRYEVWSCAGGASAWAGAAPPPAWWSCAGRACPAPVVVRLVGVLWLRSWCWSAADTKKIRGFFLPSPPRQNHLFKKNGIITATDLKLPKNYEINNYIFKPRKDKKYCIIFKKIFKFCIVYRQGINLFDIYNTSDSLF